MRDKKDIILKIILFIFIFTFIGTGSCLGLYYYRSINSRKDSVNIKENAYVQNDEIISMTNEQDMDTEDESAVEKLSREIIDFDMLKSVNSEIIGWLKIPGTSVDYPVVSGPEDDEQYYLHRNIKKKYDNHGTLFYDTSSTPGLFGTMSLIYGHHMRDGSMFADLAKYESREFYKKHSKFYIFSEGGNYKLKIVSVFRADVGNEDKSFRYDRYLGVIPPEKYEEFRQNISERELYATKEHWEQSDMTVMLSTCDYSSKEGRIVLLGKCVAAAAY